MREGRPPVDLGAKGFALRTFTIRSLAPARIRPRGAYRVFLGAAGPLAAALVGLLRPLLTFVPSMGDIKAVQWGPAVLIDKKNELSPVDRRAAPWYK